MATPQATFPVADIHSNRPAASTGATLFPCSTHGKIERYNIATAAWEDWLTLPTAGLTDPMTTRGDIIVRNSSNVTARKAVGSANTVLTSDGTDPAWGSVTPAMLDVSADNTTANATSGHHGLLPKLSGSSSDALKGDGSWGSVSGGGPTHAYAGYNTVGGSTENVTTARVYGKKITLANDCLLTSISARVIQSSDNIFAMNAAVFADNSSTIGYLLAYNANPSASFGMQDSASPTYVAGWVAIPIGIWLPAGDYWIAVQINVTSGTFQLYYDTSGSDRYYTPGGMWFTHGQRYSQTDSTRKYSIRASTIH